MGDKRVRGGEQKPTDNTTILMVRTVVMVILMTKVTSNKSCFFRES